jgi:hypothetical protein
MVAIFSASAEIMSFASWVGFYVSEMTASLDECSFRATDFVGFWAAA